ncbi:hypothetical protein E1B28_009427 [Marasmius oreades]|uniref:Chromo domain-containing protein n=1 Tax=Marasmius oreades TaxID=181124 RepID=A0A9P7S0D8_9AGAR|nr:uncharacterized protein E1B28_009427 [Marasmius oreades]KAG7093144.1 hypothetical protein E1B28_009427 [Marasmius oreades]
MGVGVGVGVGGVAVMEMEVERMIAIVGVAMAVVIVVDGLVVMAVVDNVSFPLSNLQESSDSGHSPPPSPTPPHPWPQPKHINPTRPGLASLKDDSNQEGVNELLEERNVDEVKNNAEEGDTGAQDSSGMEGTVDIPADVLDEEEEGDEVGVMNVNGHCWIAGRTLQFLNVWSDGDITWEPMTGEINNLEAVDKYLEHHDCYKPFTFLAH